MNEQIDIAAIRARVAAATPGPWVRGIARDDDGWAVLANDGDDEVCTQPPSRVIDPYSPADADLIAHAPADIAALCDEVERLRADLDDARNVALGLTEDCAGLRERLAAAEAPPTQRGFSVVCNCDGVRRGCTLGTDDEPCDCLCHDLEPRAAGEVTP